MHDLMLQNPTRRKALLTGGGLASLVAAPEIAWADTGRNEPAAKALPAYASWKDADAMIVHSANTMELKRDHMGLGSVTPTNHLYVRNNLNPPSEDIVKDRDAWEIEISGVGKPIRTTLGALKHLGLTSVTMVLQCSGNGRGYFPHKPSGSKWREGAAGCVTFTGVPLKAVAEALGGVVSDAKYITGTGGEQIPEGIDPKTVMVERSVPIQELDHVLLAWEINGEPLPLAHGGPLRMIVPGYMGVNNIKYIKHLAFTADQSPAKIQQSSYRLTPVGVKGNPDAPSMWTVPVNSWLTMPLPSGGTVKAGRVQLAGVAFGGAHPIKGVEVSIDGGQTWQAAQWLGADMGPFAWRNFVLAVDLKPGKYQVATRAANVQGEVQPRERVENERGYNNNSWLDRSVELVVA